MSNLKMSRKVWNQPTYPTPVATSTSAGGTLPPPESGPSSVTPSAAESAVDDDSDEKDDDIDLRDDKTPLMVQVKRSKSYKGPPHIKAYPMTQKPRGQVLIIDNEEFVNDVMPRRAGTLIDYNNLVILFEGLGFKVSFVAFSATLD